MLKNILIFLLIVKITTAIAALKNNLKIVGYYLLGNFLLDCSGQLVQYYLHQYDKPYHGFSFLLFIISSLCYLGNATWLAFSSGKAIQEKSLQKLSWLMLITILVVILCFYPSLHGAEMLKLWYDFYLVLSLFSLGAIILKLKNHLHFDSGLMLMLNLGCLAEVILTYCHLNLYWLIYLCNMLFYFVILFSCRLNRRYTHLLEP